MLDANETRRVQAFGNIGSDSYLDVARWRQAAGRGL